ncbi:MAG: hypothetical protein IJW01_05570 [Paludibacteraceae bacterium]|nr:hypothetical protein [Paludibacteraceae bacterium]
MKKIVSLCTCFYPFLLLSAQINHNLMFKAYLSGDLSYWGKALRLAEKSDMSLDLLKQITNYEYGYIPWCLDKKEDEEAKLYLDKFARHIDMLEEKEGKTSSVFVYRSAYNAYCLSFNRWKFATYASRAIEFSNKAVQTDENNPLALSLKGNVEFYSPAMFGGSKKKALEYFQKAINAFEEKNLVNNNWNYVATMLCYAQAYDKQGEKKKAKEVCQKILSIAPTFTYVRDTYYPQLVK